MKRDETPNDDAQRRVRRLQAVKLRVGTPDNPDGMSFREIAKELGVDVHTAWDDVMSHYSAIRKLGAVELEKMRDRDLSLIDSWLAALSDKCASGDEKAIDTANRVLATRAKLTGENAPAKVELEDKTPDRYRTMPAAERIEAHRAAIAEEEAKLAEQKEQTH